MKERLIGLVKENKKVYRIYYTLGNALINILKIFVKVKNNRILFVSYGGRQFDDSPRVIYEKMKLDERFRDYELVWAFRDTNKYRKRGIECVKIDTLKFYICALSSICWITNVAIERGLSFKNKKTLYINTWHEAHPKKCGRDDGKKLFHNMGKCNMDIVCAQSVTDIPVLMDALEVAEEKIKLIGLPRNDELVNRNISIEEKKNIKRKLGIYDERPIILYAPTFRETKEGKNIIPNFKKWNKILKNKYIFLFRAHPILKNNIKEDSSFINVTGIENLNEILFVSDILISDYSGIFFEYALLNKPMFHYSYDYEEYTSNRGLTVDIINQLDGSVNENNLLKLINEMDLVEQNKKINEFRQKYCEVSGQATLKILNSIQLHIEKNNK